MLTWKGILCSSWWGLHFAQDRHACARSYCTVAGVYNLTVEVSRFGTTQKMHDLRWLRHGTQRLAFKIADLVDAASAIEHVHLGVDKARQESVNANTARIRFLDRKDACQDRKSRLGSAIGAPNRRADLLLRLGTR